MSQFEWNLQTEAGHPPNFDSALTIFFSLDCI